jgi:hypothetical protein
LPLALGYASEEVRTTESDKKIPVHQTAVDSNYFATMGIPVLAGRGFDAGDRENTAEVVLINRKMADTIWPGQDPVGKTLFLGDPVRKATVIGITADSKYETLDEAPASVLYYALTQHDEPSISLIVRTSGDPHLWVGPINQTMRAMGLMVPFAPLTLTDLINFSLIWERVSAACVAALSGLGLLLAVLGLFGAISYSVSERKKELGIRVALGARSWELSKMILLQTLRITGAGVAIGIVLGIGATALLRSQFYGIRSFEWTVLVPVTILMLGVSLVVAYLSARPWLSVDPMESVRHA